MPTIVPSSGSGAVVTPPSEAFNSPLRILKRNPAPVSVQSNGTLESTKSLVEREREYNTARERIFRTSSPTSSPSQESPKTMSASPKVLAQRAPRGPEDGSKGF